MWVNNGIENRSIKKDDIIPNGYTKGRLRHKSISYEMPKGKDSHNAGKHFINNGVNNLFVKSSEPIPEGYVKGRIINYSYVKAPTSNNFNLAKFGTKWVTDGVINKKLKKDDIIPEGFKLGKIMPTDWIWITDGIKSLKHRIGLEIPEGFKKGKVHKRKDILFFPDLNELINKIKLTGFRNVAKELGYAENTVRKFLISNGIKLDRLKKNMAG
jgi:hypothetical protein